MRVILAMTVRARRRGLAVANRRGGYILACSHISHLDPFCLSAFLPRKIGWMARIEFYQHPWAARLMRLAHAFPVNRRGVPVRAIREALQRLERREVVGVFAEGEIQTGAASVLRGGPLKRGAAFLAQRSGCPVLPCVVLGTEKLNGMDPWLPARRGRVWIGCGEFLEPVAGMPRRAARIELTAQIEVALRRLYAEMRTEFALRDSVLP